MTIDTQRLRELAQSIAEHMRSEKRTEYPREAMEHYIDAAHPFVILALLDERDAMNDTMDYMRADRNQMSEENRHMRAELENLRTIEAAARNLVKVKGRHHSEIAMDRLIEALK